MSEVKYYIESPSVTIQSSYVKMLGGDVMLAGLLDYLVDRHKNSFENEMYKRRLYVATYNVDHWFTINEKLILEWFPWMFTDRTVRESLEELQRYGVIKISNTDPNQCKIVIDVISFLAERNSD